MFGKYSIIFILAFCIFFALSCSETQEVEKLVNTVKKGIPVNKIRFLLTSTLESRLEPFQTMDGKNQKIGGFARLMTALETKRADGIPSITISNGNDVGGEIFEYFFGVATMQLLDAMKYDLICPGIAEFSKGEMIYAAAIRDTNFELVLSNVILENRGIKRKMHSNIIRELNGFKVGFFGLIEPTLKDKGKLEENSSVLDDIKKISETEILQLRNSGAEIICLISNLPNETDIEIAKNVAGINIIFNSCDDNSKNLTTITCTTRSSLNSKRSWETLVVNCLKFGGYLGVLDLTLEKTDGLLKIIENSYQNISITSALPENSELKNKIQEFLSLMPSE